ncbi:Glu/Leu/Phe/Val dehydrogenase dimerization domain-containing protein [Luteithermobacter gelatinilyticus]|uniref:Glu/Leu/Phe/Val dehydrogenase dimerization domain-containing protein n=1 Tax=Luteithermobacter gelatinilyticus TaxID=2582913 RepID=UPI0011061D71|nr:Glu/Leu/Phe/Val dehydrogenase dimerization domain-containing protein [Luteithermobacter gelatinilyticus]
MIETNQFKGHEKVVYLHDKESGLKAIIAVHDTSLGPAAGGCRMWPYENEMDALTDALRLSRGMSYKNAVAGLKLGGGKSVIIADPHKDKNEQLFRAFGRFVDSLNGTYISAEDVGISVEDMEIVAKETRHVIGLQSSENASGDPSPFTARGTYLGIKAAVKHKLGQDDLKGLTVAVQGVGHVGYHLCKHLDEAGAHLIVSDIHQPSLDRVVQEFGAKVVSVAEIMSVACDVLAPCALGAVLNDATIPALRTPIVAGAANNQLARDEHGQMLHDKGILYAPDYVINAGGIINVSAEARGKYDVNWVNDKVDNIYTTLGTIFERSDKEGRPTNVIADELAEEIIAAARARKKQEKAA